MTAASPSHPLISPVRSATDALLTLNNNDAAQLSLLSLPELEVTPLRYEQRATKFDLSLSLTETGSGLDGALEYSTDLFNRATVERLLDHYRRLLETQVVPLADVVLEVE